MIKYLPLLLLFFSCRPTKEIIKTEIRIDSSAVHKYDSLYHAYKLDSTAYENTISLLNQNNVTFECPPCDSSGNNTIVEFDSMGVIRRVEGRIKSLKTQSNYSQKEAANWKHLYDSLSHVERKDSVTVSTEIEYREKIVKRSFIPWWLWILVIAGFALYINKKFKILPIG